MRERIKTLKRLSVVLLLACFGCLGIENLPGTLAQRRSAAEQAVKEKEDPEKKLNKDLADAVEAIKKNCNSLRDTIVAANVYEAEFGYDDNQVSASFITDCKRDGELSWTAEQKFDANAHPARSAYRNKITGYAAQLEASQAKENGLVDLISETATIRVKNLLDDSSTYQVTWPLDLRDRRYAVKFVTALKELAGNLKKRDELQEKLDKLAEEKEKTEEAKPKRRPRNRRRQ